MHAAGAEPGHLHALARHPGHTVLLLGGPDADPTALAARLVELEEIVSDSPRLDAVVAVATDTHDRAGIGRLDHTGAELLGITDTTVLAVRPDGYIGLRAERDHPRELVAYDALIRAGGH